MNTLIITRVKDFIKLPASARLAGRGALAFGLLMWLAPAATSADWKVDLSRRSKTVRDNDARSDRVSTGGEEEKNFFEALFESGEPLQELVLLNTEKGFLPATVRMRKGGKYLIHVVNVNEKEKNISFVLDAFSEHHATFYGKVKSFRIEPKKEGVYSFQCPETSAEGRVVVHAPPGTPLSPPAATMRAPAAEEKR